MNAWTMLFAYAAVVLLALALLAAAAAVMIYAAAKKKPVRKPLVFLAVSAALAAVVVLFTNSHGTYIRFDDWWIYRSGAQKTEERYGAPEIGGYVQGKPGRLGYYIYKDNGPIMPDHLRHYYYVEYDGQGNVTEIYDGAQPGG